MKDDFDHSARLGTYTGSVQEKRAFLRGAFLATGTISDPRKDYHFEILAPMEDLAEFVIEQMAAFDIQGRMTKRRGRYPVYLKDSTAIADMLNVMEAHVALMDFENIRIQREMRGSINRKINCDTANINKTVAASMKQTEDIELIRDVLGFDRLSDGLRSICEARLANPDATLEELGELIPVPVGKSGVNHRLRKIGEIADQIRSSADNH